jgi:hypothetical protein
VEEIINIIIFYKEEDEGRHTLVANCDEGMEETYVVVTSLVVFFLKKI